MGADYHFSSAGNDKSGEGTQAAPWATAAKAGSLDLEPGDRLLFRAGDVFDVSTGTGPLRLDGQDAGSPDHPVTVTSYGEGRAILDADDGTGIEIRCGGVVIENLVIRGRFTNENQFPNQYGIALISSADAQPVPTHVRINHVKVHGFHEGGINIAGAYEDVRITRAEVFDIGEEGIAGHANVGDIKDPVFPIKNIYIGYSHVYDIWGRTADIHSHTGNGIFFSGVDGMLVEHCTVHNIGVNSVTTSGPVGVFAWRCIHVIFQYNEVYECRRKRGEDGGAMDFGELVSDSLIQYNYTHDNDGYGYLIDINYMLGASGKNVTVRYNISENDARNRPYGAIFINAPFEGLRIYGNTIYMSPGSQGTTSGIDLGYHQPAPTDVKVYNNIFLIDDPDNTGKVYAINVRKVGKGTFFRNNLYHNLSGNGLKFRWGSETYDSLETWSQATGQETDGNKITALTLDPRLRAPGSVGTLTTIEDRAKIDAYDPLPGSPVIDAGLNLPKDLGINAGPHDFRGEPVPAGEGFDLGAIEVQPR